MTTVLNAIPEQPSQVAEAVREGLEQHLRSALATITADQPGYGPLAVIAASYTLETAISGVLAKVRAEHADAAALNGASYRDLGDASGVSRSRAQQLWPTAGKLSKRSRWLAKHETQVRAALRDVAEHIDVDEDLGQVVREVLAADPGESTTAKLDQALRAAHTFADQESSRRAAAALSTLAAVRSIAAAADADKPLNSADPASGVLHLPLTLPANCAPAIRMPRWHGTLPLAVADAVSAVLTTFGDTAVRSIGRIDGSQHRLNVLLARLRSAVNTDSAEDVRTIVSTLIAAPVVAPHDNTPELDDAVATLVDRAELLLTCPSCGHRPAENLPLEAYAQHLSDLSCTWLGLVDGEVRELQHCHSCSPSGYRGIELSCSACDDGFLLEENLAQHRLALPPDVSSWLKANGWNTTRPSEFVHTRCTAAARD